MTGAHIFRVAIAFFLFFFAKNLFFCHHVVAQSARIEYNRALDMIEQGKDDYAEQILSSAKTKYDTHAAEILFALSYVHKKKDHQKEALKILQQLAEMPVKNQTEQFKLADVLHNIGNLFMGQKEYTQAIEAYKQSLRLRSTDDETRYNLTLALKLQKKDSGGGQENASQPENSSSPEKPSQNNPNNKIDRKQSEKILDAYRKQEEATRNKIDNQKQNQSKDRDKKNW